MQVFSIEVQRRVRLRNAKKFDLADVLGEPVIVWIGELPQVHQERVVAFLEVRRELLERVKLETGPAQGSTGEAAEKSLQRLGEDLQSSADPLDAAARVGKELTKKLMAVMQELIAAAMLDANGDRMSDEDGRALFSLLPASPEVAHLMHHMSEAVLSRIGGKKPKPDEAAAAPAEPLGK